MTVSSTGLIGCCLLLTSATAVHAQGVVTSVAVSPRTIAAGSTVSVTTSGTNPCGAVRIHYGEGGEAITYPITGLPVTETHVYSKPGNYTITAEGMGNCSGSASAALAVSDPSPSPAAPAPLASIRAVEITPTPARVQEPVVVIVRGTGTCAYELQYGDGTIERANARLPEDSHHTYTKPGRYVVIVKPNAPCVGKFTEILQVEGVASQSSGRITHILASPSPGAAGQPIAIAVHGSGTCFYDIYYGDGATEEVEGALPRSTRHSYARPGRYAIEVKPQSPCTGKFTEVVQVAGERGPTTPAGPRIAGVTAAPLPAVARQPVRLTIDGSGACALTIDYGDGNSDSRSMTLPASLRHVYSAPDVYIVTVSPDDSSCRGSANLSFEVRRR